MELLRVPGSVLCFGGNIPSQLHIPATPVPAQGVATCSVCHPPVWLSPAGELLKEPVSDGNGIRTLSQHTDVTVPPCQHKGITPGSSPQVPSVPLRAPSVKFGLKPGLVQPGNGTGHGAQTQLVLPRCLRSTSESHRHFQNPELPLWGHKGLKILTRAGGKVLLFIIPILLPNPKVSL